ncbi:ZIM-domain protein 5 [Tanacetum coccineum]
MSEIVDSGDTNKSMFSQTCNLFTHFFNTTNFQHLTPGGDRMNNIIFNKLAQKQQDDTQAARMTIFYGGQVIVLDNFPADKALEIMNMLSGTQTASSFVASDLPIARKASLARFLEKRKERITARAPYQQQQGTSPPSKQEDESKALFG